MTEYKVGYGKPPLNTRFKKGVCPNPKGRGARKPPSAIKLFRQILNREMTYREGGVEKRGTRLEVLVNKLASDAMKGDVAAARTLFGLKGHFEDHGDIQAVYHRFDQIDSEA